MNRMGKILSGFDPDKPVTDIQAADLFACIEEYERAVEMTRNYVLESIQNGVPYKRTGDQELVEFRMKKRDGHTFPAESQGSLVLDARGIPYAVRIVLRDISKRKQLEEERENLVRDLEEALEHVKTLQGLIPICSSCKKIRDDDGS